MSSLRDAHAVRGEPERDTLPGTASRDRHGVKPGNSSVSSPAALLTTKGRVPPYLSALASDKEKVGMLVPVPSWLLPERDHGLPVASVQKRSENVRLSLPGRLRPCGWAKEKASLRKAVEQQVSSII